MLHLEESISIVFVVTRVEQYTKMFVVDYMK